jgi:hypothetical protein
VENARVLALASAKKRLKNQAKNELLFNLISISNILFI